MKKNVLFRTNFVVCTVIIIGFIITSFISYRSNQGIFHKDIENVSKLTSEGIYHKIDSIFTKPINISLTMANDSLLKEFLDGEVQHLDDQNFINTMRSYLNTYRNKYEYDSVFLASAQTKRYYYYDGLDRILYDGDPENEWFYYFLNQDNDYGIKIDNDQVNGAGNEVTVFINARIEDESGSTMGVVGVGFRVNTLQALLKSYDNDFGVKACLIDDTGNIEVSSSKTEYEGISNLFESCAFPELKDSILDNPEEAQNLWYSTQKGNGFVVSRFINNLQWYLIIENDTTALSRRLLFQLLCEICIVAVTILCVLITITTVIRRYNRKIIELTVKSEKKHQMVFQQAVEQLYENIYEIDITHNRAASEATAHYFESLGAPPDIPFNEALQVIAKKQIKEEFQQGYINTFEPVNVLQSYANGTENLRYDFMISSDGKNFYWMRIIAHIFHWEEDDSIRMLVYRQNINDEKQHELYMMEQMQRDSLTGLYNKAATQEHIKMMMETQPNSLFAFFILDIDYFKAVNDHSGHAAGDKVLIEFAQTLQKQFRKDDIVGRIGGDEFIAFMSTQNTKQAKERAGKLVYALHQSYGNDSNIHEITTSIGVALSYGNTDFETLYRRADYALYQAKKNGRNRFSILKEHETINQIIDNRTN